ncbi:plasmid partitioning protein RepB [Pseudovibrio ascidiaceicola]|uniref:plasmid partitioning protein RepB n=1 Tax=Pseudovibrio ascidiaceicola TaxID=285279 RepID=UPI003D35F839
MSRKHSLSALVGQGTVEQTDEPTSRAAYVRRGASKAMQKSLVDIAESAKLVSKGDVIRTLDPKLCLPSIVSDRAFESIDEGIEQLANSIKEDGQQVPILVRPHPSDVGFYQIAYGHRRVRACLKLKIDVRVAVKELTDEELVVAQGKENAERKNLTFIQRCLFAERLSMTFPRVVVISAVGGGDKSIVSKLTAITRKIPEDIIEAIGSARGIGRVKWENLAKLCDDNVGDLSGVRSSIAQRQNSGSWAELLSHERFQLVVDLLTQTNKQRTIPKVSPVVKRGKTAANAQPTKIQNGDRFTAHVRLNREKPNIELEGPEATKFSSWLLDLLPDLVERYEKDKQKDDSA